MKKLFFIFALLIPFTSSAEEPLDHYTPPPMFENKQEQVPIPPRRPKKLRASQSYIENLRFEQQGISDETLVAPSAQDVLKQIEKR